jgi:hypothetical protein
MSSNLRNLVQTTSFLVLPGKEKPGYSGPTAQNLPKERSSALLLWHYALGLGQAILGGRAPHDLQKIASLDSST